MVIVSRTAERTRRTVGQFGWLRLGWRRAGQTMNSRNGQHERSTLLKHSATLQSSAGPSSAEADYYALVRGACFGVGVQSSEWEPNHTSQTGEPL